MGAQDAGFEEILRHYYPNTALSSLNR
jgi:peptidoglycan hydrolase-like amidase